MTRILLVRLAAGAALAAAMLAAHAADPAQHEAARLALRNAQYDRVVQLTTDIARTEPNAALNWYRMAIAAARTNDVARAADALARAERADPTLRFASTPQRVEKLRADIREGLQRPQPAAGTVGAPPLPASPADGSDIDPGAVAAVAAMAQQLQGLQESLDRKLDGLTKGMSQVNANQVAAVHAANWERAAWICGVLMAVLACGGLLALLMERAAKARRQSDLRDLARLPLEELMVATRDAAAILGQRLERHGHKDTELYVQLGRLMQPLERETGRARVDVATMVDGVLLVDAPNPLAEASKVLGRSNPQDLHKQVAQRALARTSQSQQQLAA
ncbi:hypothetical protein [Ramlibacter sp. AN1133]|uniref:hypothetical protein n=1 Tax=Ramlibacter sp. AN1133 TaxID=3133429 RepID=UPI0030BC3FD7